MALPSIGRGRSYINLVNQRHLKHWRVGRPSTLVSENVLFFFCAATNVRLIKQSFVYADQVCPYYLQRKCKLLQCYLNKF